MYRNFLLTVFVTWIAASLVKRILRKMFKRFKEEGIEIPFNQMDVHLMKD